MQRWLLRLIAWYQQAAQGRPSPCRFSPSCSEYAAQAIEVHGAARGSWLMARRLLRCRPFGPSGWDPVPDPITRRAAAAAALPHHPHEHPTSQRAPHEVI